MKAVIVNGNQTALNTQGMPKIMDLIELIKESIDPDHMITSILLDGRELEDHDWSGNTNQYETSILEIETGRPEEFVASRLASASNVVQACFLEFREARKFFKNGKMEDGNRQLVRAVNTLQAFFEWYSTLLEIVPEDERPQFVLDQEINSVSTVCKKICQQQLYQSWWALGETLENELEPALDVMEDRCRGFGV
jgi:hypothetical protein